MDAYMRKKRKDIPMISDLFIILKFSTKLDRHSISLFLVFIPYLINLILAFL